MSDTLPLEGLRVMEFTHAVMGPSAGLLLADMGAEVIHIEPPKGDPTRRLKGFGTGYFSMYNRNKKSLAVDLKATEGKEVIHELCKSSDILVENFGPGTIDRLGFSWEKMSEINPRLIYCSLKGFLDGPYEQRHAMDEVVQMMGGLAYMTGRPGDPIRAGTSIIDIAGGMFGYMGILQALYEREKTGKGKYIKSALFETCVFLMGQHMAYSTQIDFPVPPMPARVSAWSIYQIFDTADEGKIFIGIISEKHWARFCDIFGWGDFKADTRIADNGKRIDEREWFIPELEARVRRFTKADIIQKCEEAHIPFAQISRPEDLFEDRQLVEGGSLLPISMPNGKTAMLPRFPIQYGNAQVSKRNDPPEIGADSQDLLKEMGYSAEKIEQLKGEGKIG
ncbi:MAG: CaiB/BaiF CoA-transferase family protein [Bacteroidota bacterium]